MRSDTLTLIQICSWGNTSSLPLCPGLLLAINFLSPFSWLTPGSFRPASRIMRALCFQQTQTSTDVESLSMSLSSDSWVTENNGFDTLSPKPICQAYILPLEKPRIQLLFSRIVSSFLSLPLISLRTEKQDILFLLCFHETQGEVKGLDYDHRETIANSHIKKFF